MSNHPHYFVAIPLKDDVKNFLSKWQTNLKQQLAYKVWPHQQDLHITLKFLGAVEDEKLQKLKQKLKQIEKNSSFNLKVGTIGTFGNPSKPRVLWAGVEKTEPLIHLQKLVEEGAVLAGFLRENRIYSPHITLAKKWIGTTLSSDELVRIKNEYHEERMMHVDEVVIYQIFPNKNPKYEVVQTYKLQKEE